MLKGAIDDAAQRIHNVLDYRNYLLAKKTGSTPAPTPSPVPEDEYYPDLHFACHALEQGIQLTCGEPIPWPELRKKLEPIGKQTGGKLLLCFSACLGINAEKMFPGAPEIFDVLVAPTAKLASDEAVSVSVQP